jgi:hypothetical protein
VRLDAAPMSIISHVRQDGEAFAGPDQQPLGAAFLVPGVVMMLPRVVPSQAFESSNSPPPRVFQPLAGAGGMSAWILAALALVIRVSPVFLRRRNFKEDSRSKNLGWKRCDMSPIVQMIR